MQQRAVVIGAGIVGASIALALARAGHHVTIIDAHGPAFGASGRSFGWINASFFADTAHFRLRSEAIAAWNRLGVPGVTWSGALWYEEDGAGFDDMHARLRALHYPVQVIPRAEFQELEPAVGEPPERALRFASEGAADTTRITHDLIAQAQSAGASCLFGITVLGVDISQGAVRQVCTSAGNVPADVVIVAAGTATEALVGPLGVDIPMLHRPGLLLATQPLPPLISHVLVAPGQELRQLPDGRLLAPTSPNHQADDVDTLQDSAEALAEAALARLTAMLPGRHLDRSSLTLALRPVPQDGLPVVGPAGPDGLYIATMHSGVTLAPLIGELVAQELTNGGQADLLAPYRPQRFASESGV